MMNGLLIFLLFWPSPASPPPSPIIFLPHATSSLQPVHSTHHYNQENALNTYIYLVIFLFARNSSSHWCLHQSEVPDSRRSHWWIRALSKVASSQRLSTHLAKWMTIGETCPQSCCCFETASVIFRWSMRTSQSDDCLKRRNLKY